MEFYINKLGKIDKATLELKDLTIICGPNSASKTWLSYSIYHHLTSLRQPRWEPMDFPFASVSTFLNEGDTEFSVKSDKFREYLNALVAELINNSNEKIHLTFNSYPDIFKASSITSEISEDYIDEMISAILEMSYNIGLSGETLRLMTKEGDEYFRLTSEDAVENNTEEKSDLSTTSIVNILLRHIITINIGIMESVLRPFVITSERVGSLVFQKDIDGTTLTIKDKIEELLEATDSIEVEGVLREISGLTFGHRANLAVPVRKNLVAVRNAEKELKKKSYLAREHQYVSDALLEIVKGKFSVESGNLVFSASDNSHQLPITITSSSIKSLFMIDLYVNSLAQKGDVLLIDEPELNLHPDNQRLMAKVLARIANSGIKVIITTHSDYLIREINNAVMLSHDFPSKHSIMKQHNLIEEDLLKKEQISAYSVNSEGRVTQMDVMESGIDTQIFDDIIINANKLQEELYDELGV
ncbi:TPA: AAA family ATPase [Vibrio parahaemolyticus]